MNSRSVPAIIVPPNTTNITTIAVLKNRSSRGWFPSSTCTPHRRSTPANPNSTPSAPTALITTIRFTSANGLLRQPRAPTPAYAFERRRRPANRHAPPSSAADPGPGTSVHE